MQLVDKLRYSLFGASSRYILQILAMVVLARLLSPTQFGVIASTMIVINFAFIIFQIGGSAIVASSKEGEIDDAFDIATQICFSLAVLFIASVLITSTYLKGILGLDSLNALYALLTVVLVRAVTGPLEGRLTFESKFQKIAKSEAYSYFFGYFLVSIFFAIIYQSYWSIILGSISQTLILYILLRRNVSYKPKLYPFEKYKLYLKLGSGYLVSKLFNYLSSQGDNIVINHYMDKESLGIYGKAYQLMVVPTNFLGQVINRVFIPHFKKNRPDKIFTIYLFLNFSFSLIFSLFMVFFAKDFVTFVLGPDWLKVSPILTILSACLFARIDYKFSESIIISNREIKKLSIINASYTILFLILCVLFIGQGLTGIAKAVFISTLIYSLLMYFFSKLYHNQKVWARIFYALSHSLFCYIAFLGL